jgi:hypothetical protein
MTQQVTVQGRTMSLDEAKPAASCFCITCSLPTPFGPDSAV